MKNCIIILLLSCIQIFAESVSYWIETSSNDWQDGYFYRSTMTDTSLKIKTYEDWYDITPLTWTYRMVISVDNRSNSENLTDYQITFTTDTKTLINSGRMQDDCGDIRFCDSDGKTIIPHWIETGINTSSTVFWLKIPYIGAGTKKYIFMYYKCSVTTGTIASRNSIFDLYEDWETGTIDQSVWIDGGGAKKFRIANPSIPLDRVYEGNYSVCNDTISNNEFSEIYTVLNLPMRAKISFWWCVDSEASDKISFRIDGIEKASYGDLNRPWEKKIFSTDSSGSHSYAFRYTKDPSASYNADRGFVDKIIVTKYTYPEPNVSLETNEQKQGIYYLEGIYQSDVKDAYGQNAEVIYVSWTYTGSGVAVKMRTSNTIFTKDSSQPQWTQIPNNSKPPVSRGEYIQYRVELTGDGSATPSFEEISIQFQAPPKRPTDFKGIALSTYSIKWLWTDNANSDNSDEIGYRIYSDTFPYSEYVSSSETRGLIKELPKDSTEWIETDLSASIPYSRYVVAYNQAGGNAGVRFDGELKAHTKYTLPSFPEILGEIPVYKPTPLPVHYEYEPSTIGVPTNNAYFSFTSKLSTGSSPGRVQYYRYAWSTQTFHNWTEQEPQWIPIWISTAPQEGAPLADLKPLIKVKSNFNSNNWYFHCKSYNGDNEGNGITVLGPYWFNGCPSQITNLSALPGSNIEGEIILTWTSPSADEQTGDLENAKYIIKYRPGMYNYIYSDSIFDSVTNTVTITTSSPKGTLQMISITGLIPGTRYNFAIKTQDSEGNMSDLSNFYVEEDASKVSEIVFLTSPQQYIVGYAGGIITIETRDKYSRPLKILQSTNIRFQTSSSQGLFSLDGKTFGAPLVNIPVGNTQANFYYKDLQSGNPVITVFEDPSQSWKDGQQQQIVVPGPATTFRINHDGYGEIWTPEKITVSATDEYGNISQDFLSSIISTTNIDGAIIEPSTHSFSGSDNGKKTFEMRNYFKAGDSYIEVNEVTDEYYKDVFFYDNVNGWFVGNKGSIRKTNNGGNSWIYVRIDTQNYTSLNSLYFPDLSIGYVCGNSGKILKTINSGINWSSQTITGLNENLNSIYFINISTGWVIGNSGKIYKTIDGENWFQQSSPVNNDLYSIYFLDSNNGWITGSSGTVLYTTDSGNTWNQKNILTDKNLYKIKFLNDNITGFIVGQDGYIYKTINQGNDWIVVSSASGSNLYDLYSINFPDSNNGFAVGSSGKILKTTNKGNNWVVVSSTVNSKTLYSCFFLNLNEGIFVGADGTVLKSFDSGGSFEFWRMKGKSDVLKWNGTIVQPITDIFTTPTKILQKENQAISLLGIYTLLGGNATLNKITINKLGNCPDTGVNKVKIYRDNGDRKFSSYNDTLLSEGNFSDSKVSLSFTNQSISNTTNYYFIVYDLNLFAPIGSNLGMKIDTDGLNIISGLPLARNNLPYIVSPLQIVPSSCTVSLINVSTISPSSVSQGAKDVGLLSFEMKTDTGTSDFRGIRIERTGINTTDDDIDSINIYRDEIWTENLIGWGKFSNSVAIIMITTQTITTSPKKFFITVNISPNSKYSTETQEANIGIKIIVDKNNFLLDQEGANGIISNYSEYFSSTVKINIAYDTVLVSPVYYSIPNIRQSELLPFLNLQISIDKNTALLTKLKVKLKGDAEYTDVDSIKLYRDKDDNGLFSPTTDYLIGEGVFASNKEADISFSNPETIDRVSPLYRTYFLCMQISKKAIIKRKIGIEISSNTYLQLAGVDISSGNFPINSSLPEIVDYPDTVYITIEDVSPYEARINEKNLLLEKINFWTYVSADLLKWSISQEGTSTNTVNAIKIYFDSDRDKNFSGSDILVGMTTNSVSGRYEIEFSSQTGYQEINDSSQTFFIVCDMNPQSLPDKTFGIGLDYTGISVNLPNSIFNFGYVRSKLIRLLDKRTPDIPDITLNTNNPDGIMINGQKIYYLNLQTPIDFNVFNSTPIASVYYGLASYNLIFSSDVPDITGWQIQTNPVFNTSPEVLFNPRIIYDKYLLQPKTTYYLWVKAINIDSGQNFERGKSIILKTDFTPPPKIDKPVPDKNSNWVYWNSVNDDESGILYYELQQRIEKSNLWSGFQYISIATTTTSQYYVSRSSGYFYYYRVRSKNYSGLWSDFSDESDVIYISTITSSDSGLTIKNLFSKNINNKQIYFINNLSQIDFSINLSKEITGTMYGIASYVISSSTDIPDISGKWSEKTGTDVSFTVGGLSHNKTYYLWIKAISANDSVNTSIELKTDFTPPPKSSAPINNSPGAVGMKVFSQTGSYLVYWTPVRDEESEVIDYELQERTDSSPNWISIAVTSSTQYEITRQAQHFYYYRVRARNYAGLWGEFSDTSKVAFISPPGELISDFSTFPNPFDSRKTNATIAYTLNQDADVKIKIYDLFGNEIKKFEYQKGTTGATIGPHGKIDNIFWDGTDNDNKKVGFGMYILVIEADSGLEKMKKTWKIGLIH